MFERGFPLYLNKKVRKVINLIEEKSHCCSEEKCTAEREKYTLCGSTISFPERIYFIEGQSVCGELNDTEEALIYHCIFTRSYDGYVRERHIKEILACDYPIWCVPYILKLSSEYVLNIVEDIYNGLKPKDTSAFQSFCLENSDTVKLFYSRMTSYWNEYYRAEIPCFGDYAGYKLYHECLGCDRNGNV